MLEALILKGWLELSGFNTNEQQIKNMIAGLFVSSPALRVKRNNFPTGLGRYEYDLIYLGINLADVHLEFKKFSINDFLELRNNELLQNLLRQHQREEMYTMEFSFNITKGGIVETAVSRFYNDATFKTIGVLEEGKIRPIYSMMNANENQRNDTTHTFYDRQNYQVTVQDANYNEICLDTFERNVFQKILDPLCIVLELITRQPKISDDEINIGLFYTPKFSGHLFPVILDLIPEVNDTTGRIDYQGQIELPLGAFLADNSILVKNEYNLSSNGITLLPDVRNRLFLKPNSGITSCAPGWARTESRD